jgi:hypothetical protein
VGPTGTVVTDEGLRPAAVPYPAGSRTWLRRDDVAAVFNSPTDLDRAADRDLFDDTGAAESCDWAS